MTKRLWVHPNDVSDEPWEDPDGLILEVVLATEIAEIRKAGDALAEKLRRSPGIDPMRNYVLNEWERVT